jgi:hypothetical protein
MRLRRAWGVLLVLLLPAVLLAQVSPPGGGGGTGGFPVTTCVNAVGTGITADGVLVCATVVPAMTTGLVPSGGDVSPTGQVTATHLAAPLPLGQGGLGLTAGNAGGLLYFTSPTTLAASPVLTLSAPLFGGGDGQPPTLGTRSGTTLEVATVLGPHTVDKQLTFDPNGNIVATASDIGGGGGGGSVTSVFGRTGTVSAQSGDYTADQVINAAHLQQANTFANPSGQTMTRLNLSGTISGTLSLRPPAFAGTSMLTFPAGTLDMTTTGGPGQVLRQLSAAGPLTVGQMAFADLTGTTTVCTTAGICSGYQAALGFTAENVANKTPATALGTSDTFYPTQNAVKVYVDTGLAGKQNTLGFTPEDVARKNQSTALGSSITDYPTQNAVKVYVDTALATKQAALGFVPEDVARKNASTALGTSTVDYPTQNAVKVYVDTGLTGKQNVLGFTAEDVARKNQSTSLGTSTTDYPSQNAVKVYVDTVVATKQGPITWGAGLAASGDTARTDSLEVGFLTNGVATALSCGVGQSGKMQVLATGELQYCDGATTAVLRSGQLTQTGLTWNITAGSCTGDANGGKLTLNPAGTQIVCASDIGGTGGGGGVTSVFGRTGAVVSQTGDYSVSQVTNAADLTAANVFPHATGQSMAQLRLLGATTGMLTLRAPAVAGASVVTLPAGSTDFSVTGGAGQVVRQSTLGGVFTVGTLAFSDLTGTAGVCTTGSICAGYQAALGFNAEDVAHKNQSTSLGTSTTDYPSQNAVKVYVDTGLATKQATLGFTPEDVARKNTSTSLGTSTVDYPTQNAVKVYVDTAVATKQGPITWGAGLAATGDTARTASTEADFLTDGGVTNLTCGASQQGKMQVMDNGELQYCGGEVTPLLHGGALTQTGLTWNVTSTACTTDPNGGKLTIVGTQIVCGADAGGGGGGAISGGTANGAVYATGTTTATSTAAMTDGQLLIGRTGTTPFLGSLQGTANQIRVTAGPGTIVLDFPPAGVTLPGTTTGSFSGSLAGNAATATGLSSPLACAQHPALTGDVTTAACVATLANNSVTLPKMATVATASFLGRATAGTGIPEVLTATQAKTLLGMTFADLGGTVSCAQHPALTGDVTTAGCVATLANNSVTLAKMATVTTASFLGRATAGTGIPEVLTATQAKTLLGMTFVDLGGAASDAQIPDLNLLSSGLTASRCVQTDATGKLGVTAGPCGTGGGVGIFGTPIAGQVALWHDASSVEGVSALTIAYAAAHVTGSGTVTTGVEYVQTGPTPLTRTLPPASSGTTTRRFRVIKEDSGVGALNVAPAGADTINGGTAVISTSLQWAGFQLDEVSPTGWISTPILPGAGAGDFSTNTSTSLADEIVLFSNTTGKQGKRATTNGVLAATAGVLRQAIGGSDIVTPTGAEDVSNKRIARRVAQLSAATGTVTAPNAGVAGAEIYYRHDISGALTIPIPSGTPFPGQQLLFRLKPQTTPQTLTFTGGAGGFCAVAGLSMPTTTGDNATYVEYGFTYADTVSPNACWVLDGATKATAPLSLADGGLGVSLADPNANRVLVWDDTLNQMRLAVLGPGLTYSSAPNTLSPGGIRYISLECIPDATAWTVANGKCYAPISPDWNGWSVTNVTGYLGGAVSSSGLPTVTIDLCAAVATGVRCSGTPNRALFTTALTFDTNESRSTLAATQPLINAAANNAVVASGEYLRVNVTTAGTGTQGLYLIVTLTAP